MISIINQIIKLSNYHNFSDACAVRCCATFLVMSEITDDDAVIRQLLQAFRNHRSFRQTPFRARAVTSVVGFRIEYRAFGQNGEDVVTVEINAAHGFAIGVVDRRQILVSNVTLRIDHKGQQGRRQIRRFVERLTGCR